MQKAKDELPGITYCLSPSEAAQNADAILILTEWAEFQNPDWANLVKIVAHPLVIDGRNLYSQADVVSHGFQYVCIGKPHVPQVTLPSTAKELPPLSSVMDSADPRLSVPPATASAQPQP